MKYVCRVTHSRSAKAIRKITARASLAVVATFGVVLLAGNGYAASPAPASVSPMPFSAGQPASVSANIVGPFTNASAYVSIASGGVSIVDQRVSNLGSVGAGQSQPFSFGFVAPIHPQAKGLSVFVAFLEGSESWVGEPGTPASLTLIGQCSRATDKAARPCRYATPKYWRMITKVNTK